MRIAFFELEGWENHLILKEFPTHEVYLSRNRLTPEEIPSDTGFEVISVFVESQITADVIAKFPNLKFIATRSTGYDHIDIAACKARGIAISFVPGYGDSTVAEFTFGLLLALTRKIYLGAEHVKEHGSFSLEGLRGVDLLGRTIGVIGTGRIGRHTLRIAQGFGMRIVAYDPKPDVQFSKDAGFEYHTLEEVLRMSDIITIHCPLTLETKHLINMQNISQLRRGSYLINTARGGIVATEALVWALQEGFLAGAALDVLEEEGETKEELHILASGHPNSESLENILRNHILMKMPNVLVTPHLAFNSVEALQRIVHTTIANVKGYLKNEMFNLVP
jgi:D-lactate dehydrogenase